MLSTASRSASALKALKVILSVLEANISLGICFAFMKKMGKGVLGSYQKYSRLIPGSELRKHLWQFLGNHMQHRETNQGQLCARKVPNPLHYLSGLTYLLIVKIGTCVFFHNGQVTLT